MRSVALSLLMLSSAFPQAFVQNSGVQHPQENQEDYRLGPGDVLSVTVLGLKEYASAGMPGLSVTVSNSGKIHLPYLGVLTVTDMTSRELEFEVSARLRSLDLLREPQVHLHVLDYRAHTVYILGEVEQPGQYTLRGETYLMDLVGWGSASAGGKSQHDPNKVGYLYRRSLGQSKINDSDSGREATGESTVGEAIRIDFKELWEGKHPELNFPLQGGDVLYVPQVRPDFFYVVGDLNRSGAIEIPRGSQVLVTQAISQAGGPLNTARMSKGLVIRYDESGTRQELATDFDAILRGKKPDFVVRPNDIIFIPGSQAKTVAYGLLNIMPTLASRALIF